MTAIGGLPKRSAPASYTMPRPCFREEGSSASTARPHPEIRRSVYSAGNQSSVFTAGPLSFGIIICNSNYPELATDMVARGASAISRVSRAVDIARARDNEVMIVRADVAGRTANRFSFGSSAIVDARGTVTSSG